MNNLVQEVCPHCDCVNDIVWDGVSQTTVCKDCRKHILLCSLCDMDNVSCKDCELIVRGY